MPNNPVEDLKIHPRENDLIVGTHGRSIWIADISWLQEINQETLSKDFHLFQPEDKVKWVNTGEYNSSSSNYNGESEPAGVPFTLYLKSEPKEIKLQVFEGSRMIYETIPAKKAGVNQVVWNFAKRGTEPAPTTLGQGGGRSSFRGIPTALPGTYTVKLIVDGKVQTRSFNVLKDVYVSQLR